MLRTVKVGGEGGFDYVYADTANRRLYVPRSGATTAHVMVFNLDTLQPVGEIAHSIRPSISAESLDSRSESHNRLSPAAL